MRGSTSFDDDRGRTLVLFARYRGAARGMPPSSLMLWEDIRARWDELVDEARERWTELSREEIRASGGDRRLFVAVIQQRLGVTQEDAEVSIETWVSDLTELELEPLDEASRHACRDDFHEQRECDQECEGIVHWPPPHAGTGHLRARPSAGR